MSQAVKCEVCGFDNPTGHFYCGRCGNNLAIPDSNTSTSLLKAPIEGERKQVTIIFADISGFTALNDAATNPAEVEQVIRIINYLLNDLSEVIYEFDGYIDKYIGDAIMAIFGAPRAHEDDPMGRGFLGSGHQKPRPESRPASKPFYAFTTRAAA